MKFKMSFIATVLCVLCVVSESIVRSAASSPQNQFLGIAPEGPPSFPISLPFLCVLIHTFFLKNSILLDFVGMLAQMRNTTNRRR